MMQTEQEEIKRKEVKQLLMILVIVLSTITVTLSWLLWRDIVRDAGNEHARREAILKCVAKTQNVPLCEYQVTLQRIMERGE